MGLAQFIRCLKTKNNVSNPAAGLFYRTEVFTIIYASHRVLSCDKVKQWALLAAINRSYSIMIVNTS